MGTFGLIEDTTLTSIADAIRDRLDSTNTMTPTEMPEQIANIHPTADELYEGVNFIDHDGAVLYSYSWDEIAELSELPILPNWTTKHNNIEITMICEGWNWTLSALQAASGIVYVGAVYKPEDGHTHIFAEIGPSESVSIQAVVSGNLLINWGDGTEETLTASMKHEYTNEETTLYDITISAEDDTAYWYPYGESTGIGAFGQKIASSLEATADNSKYTQIKAVYFGEEASRLGDYAFNNLYTLEEVTFCSSQSYLGAYGMQNCFVLKNLILPNTITTLWRYVFYGCYSLRIVSIPSDLLSVRTGVFRNCRALIYGRIQGTMDDTAAYLFAGCYSLHSLKIPDSWIAFGTYMLQNCAGLTTVSMPENLTDIAAYTFYGDVRLYSIDGLYISSEPTDAFYGCYELTELTNVKYIGASVDFSDCPLSYSSLINVISALSETTEGLTLTIGDDNLEKLSDEEIAVGTDKGWTII